MKKYYLVVIAVLALGIFLGFSNSDNPYGSRTTNNTGSAMETPVNSQSDNNNPVTTSGILPYYLDNFDLPNDTNSLKARGYLVYYRGEGPQGIFPTWLHPTGVFDAFNGPQFSYVASNFNSATSNNDIDNWLVLPDLDVVAGDTIKFQCRSTTSTFFPDSVRVMYNDQGGATPESPGWVQLGVKFRANDAGWQLISRIAPTSGLSARFAIRYNQVDGGPFGNNADYIGIDALQVCGDGVLPVELSSFVSVVTNNNVTLNWSTATETNNSGFEMERSNVRGQTSNDWIKIGFVQGNGTTNSPINYSLTDKNLSSGNYNYRLKQIDFNGNFEYFNLSNEVNIGVPVKFELSQNYPNPFNPTTKIEYQLPNDGNINISVFDNAGKEVASLINEFKSAGYYAVNFNAASLSSGIYFYQIRAGDFSAVKKMVLVK